MPEAVDKYPEVKTFGPTIPAYGIWARHVKGLNLINISIKLRNNDLRPAVSIEDGKEITIYNCKFPVTQGALSVIRLANVNNASINKTKINGNSEVFIRVEGESGNIRIRDNKIPGIKTELSQSVEKTSFLSH